MFKVSVQNGVRPMTSRESRRSPVESRSLSVTPMGAHTARHRRAAERREPGATPSMFRTTPPGAGEPGVAMWASSASTPGIAATPSAAAVMAAALVASRVRISSSSP